MPPGKSAVRICRDDQPGVVGLWKRAAGAAAAIAALQGVWMIAFEAWLQPSPRHWAAMFAVFLLLVWPLVVFAWRPAWPSGRRATLVLAISLVLLDVGFDLWFDAEAPPPVLTRFALPAWQLARTGVLLVACEAAAWAPATRAVVWSRRTVRALSLLAIAAFVGLGICIGVSGARDQAGPADAMILLGADLDASGRPGPSLVARAEHAAALYHAGMAPLVVTTGGRPRGGHTEGEAARDLLVERGVPAEAILVERRATSTEENFACVAALLADRSTRRVLVVTEPWHMPRAMYQGERYGLELRQAPASSAVWRSVRKASFALFSESLAYVFQRVRRLGDRKATCPD